MIDRWYDTYQLRKPGALQHPVATSQYHRCIDMSISMALKMIKDHNAPTKKAGWIWAARLILRCMEVRHWLKGRTYWGRGNNKKSMMRERRNGSEERMEWVRGLYMLGKYFQTPTKRATHPHASSFGRTVRVGRSLYISINSDHQEHAVLYNNIAVRLSATLLCSPART